MKKWTAFLGFAGAEDNGERLSGSATSNISGKHAEALLTEAYTRLMPNGTAEIRMSTLPFESNIEMANNVGFYYTTAYGTQSYSEFADGLVLKNSF